MLNNIFDKKNVEYSLTSNNSLPYGSDDVSLKKDQIIFTSINNIFQKLLDNDLYNDQLVRNIKTYDTMPGPTITDNIKTIFNAQDGKKFVLTNDEGDVKVVNKVLCSPDAALSGPQIPDKYVNFLVSYNEYFVAGTNDGIWITRDKTSNDWRRPIEEDDFLIPLENLNAKCYAINNYRGEFNNKLDEYEAFIGTNYGIYAHGYEKWEKIIPELENEYIENIFVSPNEHSIFISTPTAFYSYNGVHLTHELGIFDKTSDLTELSSPPKDQRLLVATESGIKQSQTVFTFDMLKREHVFNNQITEIIGDSHLRFIGTASGLYRYPHYDPVDDLANKYIYSAAYSGGNCYVIADGSIYSVNYRNLDCTEVHTIDVEPYVNIHNEFIKKIRINGNVAIVATDNSLFFSRLFNDERNLAYWRVADKLDEDVIIRDLKFKNNKIYVSTNQGVRIYDITDDINTFDLIFTNELSSMNISFAKEIDGNTYICAKDYSKYSKYSLYRYSESNEVLKILSNANVKDIVEYKDKTYIAMSNGLRYVNGKIADICNPSLSAVTLSSLNENCEPIKLELLKDDLSIRNLSYIEAINDLDSDEQASYLVINTNKGITYVDVDSSNAEIRTVDNTNDTISILNYDDHIYGIQNKQNGGKVYRLFVNFQRIPKLYDKQLKNIKDVNMIVEQYPDYDTISQPYVLTANNLISSNIILSPLYLNKNFKDYNTYYLKTLNDVPIKLSEIKNFRLGNADEDKLSIVMKTGTLSTVINPSDTSDNPGMINIFYNDISACYLDRKNTNANLHLSDLYEMHNIAGASYDSIEEDGKFRIFMSKDHSDNKNIKLGAQHKVNVNDIDFIPYSQEFNSNCDIVLYADNNGLQSHIINKTKVNLAPIKFLEDDINDDDQDFSAISSIITNLDLKEIDNSIDSNCTAQSIADIYYYNKQYKEVYDGINFVGTKSGVYAARLKNKLTEINTPYNIDPTGIIKFNEDIVIPSKHGLYKINNDDTTNDHFSKINNELASSYINNIKFNNNNSYALLGKNDKFILKSSNNDLMKFYDNVVYDNLKKDLSTAACGNAIILDNAMSTIIENTDVLDTIEVKLKYNGEEVNADISSNNELYNHVLIGTASYGAWIKDNDDDNTWYKKNDLIYVKASTGTDFGSIEELKNANAIDPEYHENVLTALVDISNFESLISFLCNKYNGSNDTSISSIFLLDVTALKDVSANLAHDKKHIIELSDTISARYSFKNPYQLYDETISSFNNIYLGNLTADNLIDFENSKYKISLFSFNPGNMYPDKPDNLEITTKNEYFIKYTYELNNVKDVIAKWHVSNNKYDKRLSSVGEDLDFEETSVVFNLLDSKKNNIEEISSNFSSVINKNQNDQIANVELELTYTIVDSEKPAIIKINNICASTYVDAYIVNNDYSVDERFYLYGEHIEFKDKEIYTGNIKGENLPLDTLNGTYSISPFKFNLNNRKYNEDNFILGQNIRIVTNYTIKLKPSFNNIKNVKLTVGTENIVFKNIVDNYSHDSYENGYILKTFDNIENGKETELFITSVFDGILNNSSNNIIDLGVKYEIDNLNNCASIDLNDIKITASCTSYLIKVIDFSLGGMHYLHSKREFNFEDDNAKLDLNIDLSHDKENSNGYYIHDQELLNLGKLINLDVVYKDITVKQQLRLYSICNFDFIPTFDNIQDISITVYSKDNVFVDLPKNYMSEDNIFYQSPQSISTVKNNSNNNINLISIFDKHKHNHIKDKIYIKLCYKKNDNTQDSKFNFSKLNIKYKLTTYLIDMIFIPLIEVTNDLLYFDREPSFSNKYISFMNYNSDNIFWELNLNDAYGFLKNTLHKHEFGIKKINLGQAIYSYIPITNKSNNYNELVYFYKKDNTTDGIIHAIPLTNKSLDVLSSIVNYKETPTKEITQVNCIDESNNLIIVGTNHGVFYSKKANGYQYLYTKVDLLENDNENNITSIKVLNGNVYCGSSNGLFILSEINNKLYEAAYLLKDKNVIAVFDNEARHDNDVYITVAEDDSSFKTFECTGLILNNEVLFNSEIPEIHVIYEKNIYHKDIAVGKDMPHLYLRDKRYDLSEYKKIINNELTELNINDITTSLQNNKFNNYDQLHYVLASTNNGLYIKSYILDSKYSLDPKNDRISWHRVNFESTSINGINTLLESYNKDCNNIKSAIIYNNILYLLINNIIFISQKTIDLDKICNDTDLYNNGEHDFSSILSSGYYFCNLDPLNITGIKYTVYNENLRLLTDKGLYDIKPYSYLSFDPSLSSDNVLHPTAIDIYRNDMAEQLIVGTYNNGLYELSTNSFSPILKTTNISGENIEYNNIKFEPITVYGLNNNDEKNKLFILEKDPWRYNDIHINTQFIHNDIIILGTIRGLFRRSLTNLISCNTVLWESHDIIAMDVLRQEVFASYINYNENNNEKTYKLVSANRININNKFKTVITSLAALKDNLLISETNEITAFTKENIFKKVYSEYLQRLFGKSDLTIEHSYESSFLSYISNGKILVSFLKLDYKRAFLDGIGSYYYLSKTYDKNVNKIVKLDDKNFLIGWCRGFRHVIDNSLTHRYINRYNPDLSLNKNVKVIADAYNLNGSKKYLIAQRNKIYSTENLIDINYEIRTIPYKNIEINDILVDGLNSYGIATSNGVYFTSTKYALDDALTKYTIDSVKDIMIDHIKYRLSGDFDENHIDKDHNDNSLITHLNKKLDTNFSSFPKNVYTDDYYHLANGVQVVENDIIENIEFNDGQGKIKAAIRNVVTDAIGGKCNYSDTAYVDEFTDANNNIFVDMFNIEYIIKTWQSGLKEFYIYLPSTATYYMNNPYGFSTSKYATAFYTRKNIMPVPSFVNNIATAATCIRLYINNVYFKLTEIEQIQITGNSLPLKIYKDDIYCSSGYENLFDTVIQPSIVKSLPKANGNNVNNINNLIDKQHRLVIDFCAYGTDAQAIKILGR